jgi:hypothetical protein
MKKLTPEEQVVLLFALSGLGGGVLVYVFLHSPLLTSCFLAVGVASLIYGFLGGIGETTFVFGALKLTGSIAALVGTLWMLNHYLVIEAENARLARLVKAPIDRPYEWQWAGEGWIAYITMDENSEAHIEMSKVVTCSAESTPDRDPKKERTQVRVAEQRGPGKAEFVDNQSKLRISIPVQFFKYEGCKRTGPDGEVTVLKGILDRKAAYAGRIEYQSRGSGDMILVDYLSGVRF